MTACGQSLQANSTYVLQNDIGSTPSTQCLHLNGPNLVINLNGHTVTGTIIGTNIDHNGLHIYNGTVTCQDNSSSTPGCIYIGSDASSFSKVMEIDHLVLRNTLSSSANSERNLMVDFSSISRNSVSGPNVKIHDITSTSATGTNSSRIVNLQVQGTAHATAAYVEFYNNRTTCVSAAAACQGIVAYGLYNAKIHDNTITNQRADASLTETPRGVICDQTDGCEIYNNTFDAQDGRAVRLRGTSAKNGVNSVHNNTVNNVVRGSNSNQVAAFHFGDPDSGSEVENAEIYNNTINASTGQVIMVRAATGINIHDNTINQTGSGNLLDVRAGGGATGAQLLRTTIVGGTTSSVCDAGTNVTVCKSGNASGCSVNNNGC